MNHSRTGRRCAVLTAAWIAASQLVSAAFAQNTSQLSGFVYLDRNNDGQLAFDDQPNPEFVLPDVTIQLYSISGTAATLLATTQTDSIGQYMFSGLAAGTYALSQVQPIEFIDGLDTIGQIRSLAWQLNPPGSAIGTAGNNFFTGIQLPAASRGDLYNFGELRLAPEFISKRYLFGSATPLGPAPPPLLVPEPTGGVLALLAGLGGLLTTLRRRG